MTQAEIDLKELLRQAGQSATGPRLAVFRALLGEEPMTMAQLVRRAGTQADRASVYRTVQLFERLGIAQRLYAGWKYKIELTDRFNEHHHHLTCVRCGRTISMNEDELERTVAALASSHNFTPTAHQIEVQGVCADCHREA